MPSKKFLRDQAFLRQQQAATDSPGAPLMARDIFMAKFGQLDTTMIVAGTLPIRHEMDARPTMLALHARGHDLCLPISLEKGTPLVFRRYAPGDSLSVGAWGIQIPLPEQPEVSPQLIICPLLAFDKNGGRLGYGGGFYDATLYKLRKNGTPVLAIGLCYAVQEVDEVPMHTRDQRLDGVVTEKGVMLFS